MVVDHRPRALAILGVTQEEKEELMPHFVVRTVLIISVIVRSERLNIKVALNF